MHVQLRKGLSCCRIDGRLVFLDVHQDRYFQLSPRLESAFLRYARGEGLDAEAVPGLLGSHILEPADSAPSRPPLQNVEPAHRSAMEDTSASTRPTTADILEVLYLVSATRLALRTRRLGQVLASLRSRCPPPLLEDAPRVDDWIDLRLLDSTRVFQLARHFVPIEPRCLLDSISLVRFLAARGFHTRLVFGVTLDPFGAHCWVQSGRWVLNDTVGNVLTHTPIGEF